MAHVFSVLRISVLVALMGIPAGGVALAQTTPVAGATFGVVDVGRVLNESKARQQITAELERTQRTYSSIMQRLTQGSARFLTEGEVTDLAALYEKSPLTDAERKRLGALEEKGDTLKRELIALQNTQKPDDAQTARYTQLTDMQEKGGATFEKLNRTLSTRLQEKARDAEIKSLAAVRVSVAKIAKAKGLTVVFTGDIAIYATTDITDDVLKEVNK